MKEDLIKFIKDNFQADALKDDTSLLDENIIDSNGVLELVIFIEETYNIKIEDAEIMPENLDSINNIVKFIGSKK